MRSTHAGFGQEQSLKRLPDRSRRALSIGDYGRHSQSEVASSKSTLNPSKNPSSALSAAVL